MKKLIFPLTLGATVFLYISMSISARENRFSFQTVIFPGDTFTQLLGINDFEMIAGYHGATVNQGFVFTFPNNFTPENFPGSAQTQVIGINNRGFTDGFYIDSALTTHGFLDINGTFTTVDFPGTTFNQLLGLNIHDRLPAITPMPQASITPTFSTIMAECFWCSRSPQPRAARRPQASTVADRSQVFTSTALGSTTVFCSPTARSPLSISRRPPSPRHSA